VRPARKDRAAGAFPPGGPPSGTTRRRPFPSRHRRRRPEPRGRVAARPAGLRPCGRSSSPLRIGSFASRGRATGCAPPPGGTGGRGTARRGSRRAGEVLPRVLQEERGEPVLEPRAPPRLQRGLPEEVAGSWNWCERTRSALRERTRGVAGGGECGRGRAAMERGVRRGTDATGRRRFRTCGTPGPGPGPAAGGWRWRGSQDRGDRQPVRTLHRSAPMSQNPDRDHHDRPEGAHPVGRPAPPAGLADRLPGGGSLPAVGRRDLGGGAAADRRRRGGTHTARRARRSPPLRAPGSAAVSGGRELRRPRPRVTAAIAGRASGRGGSPRRGIVPAA